MNFTVDWAADARRELHELWVISPDPAAVWDADKSAERLLAADPSGSGRHLSEGLWQLKVSPLTIYYDIDHARRHVQVTDVFHTG